MGTTNLLVERGLPLSGTTAQLPSKASTGATFWDGKTLYVYDDVTGWNLFSPVASGATSSGQTGIGYTQKLPLLTAKTSSGIPLPTTAAAGKLATSSTPGTSLYLLGEAAQNTSKTDGCQFELTIPRSYIAGTALSITINAQYNVSGGTVPTCTVAASLYLAANAGTEGSNLVTTSATALTTSAADYVFAVTGTTLTPGARVIIGISTVIREAGNTGTLTGQVNSVRWS
ncbi:MAG: hypothetical protein KGL39_42490 [Patescibacteria group bacterium]|nr:hypothetical protein [Patescibacteria group bacterium]